MTLSNTSFDFLWLCLIFLTELNSDPVNFKFLKEKLFQLFRQLQNNMQTNYFTNNTKAIAECSGITDSAGSPILPARHALKNYRTFKYSNYPALKKNRNIQKHLYWAANIWKQQWKLIRIVTFKTESFYFRVHIWPLVSCT